MTSNSFVSNRLRPRLYLAFIFVASSLLSYGLSHILGIRSYIAFVSFAVFIVPSVIGACVSECLTIACIHRGHEKYPFYSKISNLIMIISCIIGFLVSATFLASILLSPWSIIVLLALLSFVHGTGLLNDFRLGVYFLFRNNIDDIIGIRLNDGVNVMGTIVDFAPLLITIKTSKDRRTVPHFQVCSLILAGDSQPAKEI